MVLEKKRPRHFVQFIVAILGFIFFCWVLVSMEMEGGIANPFIWIISLPGLWILYSALKALQIALNGEQLIFDKNLNSYSVNSSEKCKLSDVSHVHVKRETDGDGHTDYELFLALLNGKKVFIDRSSNKDNIDEMAKEIAHFVRVSIKLKR